MTNSLRLLLILALVSAVSCIDSDYDLSKISTDDLTIGGEGSEFRIPLATVRITMREIGSEGVNIQHIFDQADTWLPTALPDSDTDGTYVDIVKLSAADAVYTSTLLDKLTSQMQIDDAKCNAVAKQIFNTPAYKEFFKSYLPTGLDTEAPFVEAFRTAFRANTSIQNEAKKLASSYLALRLKIALEAYTIEGVNIGSKVVDMLSKNLGKPGNSLKIYGEVISLLPVSITLTSPQFAPTAINFGNIEIAADATSKINPTNITEQDLRQLVDRVVITLPVTLTKYYPNKGFKASENTQVTIYLRLLKEGGLDLTL